MRYFGLVAVPLTILVLATTASANGGVPTRRLITPDSSIGAIRLTEPRASVERILGRGTSTHRGVVSYFGGRLVVNYWFHDGLTKRVQFLATRWPGFHTRSGVRVGSSRQALRALHVSCIPGQCSRHAARETDSNGTIFTMRSGKVAEIEVGYF